MDLSAEFLAELVEAYNEFQASLHEPGRAHVHKAPSGKVLVLVEESGEAPQYLTPPEFERLVLDL